MIDHVSIGVRDLEQAARFYETVLATIGLSKLADKGDTVGFGKRYSEFWLNWRSEMPSAAGMGVHVCLRAGSTEAVDAFHAAALQGGASSEGPPGRRPEYSEGYYAAFFRDADGNRIEAVTFLTGPRAESS
jgi:catechol 2,3-dioxygenase-like lactoylglutathione lyase family enzyme